MKQISYKCRTFKIRTKVIVAYAAILLLSLLISSSAFYILNMDYTKSEIGKGGMQTVNALKGNLALIFENVTSFSEIVYFDTRVQDSLVLSNAGQSTAETGQTIGNSLSNMVLSGDYISGVYIRDYQGNFYSSFTNAPEKINSDLVESTQWYRNLPSYNGNGHFIYGSEGVIQYYDDINYITYVREIRDYETYEPLAALLVTVNESVIQSYFEDVGSTYESDFFILDGDGEFVIRPRTEAKVIDEMKKINRTCAEETYSVSSVDQQEVIVVCQEMGIEDWKLVGVFELDHTKVFMSYFFTVFLIIVGMNVFLILVCWLLLTGLIFKPLEKLAGHMIMLENRSFQKVPLKMDGRSDEITHLTDVYNHMVEAMEGFIAKIKEEENVIARNELELLQAQISPHFLYNTLDAVSALALVKDYENCFRMTQALGNFYRNSLNSGRLLVSVEDEIECIKSYVTILNIRYDNRIVLNCEVEPEILQCQMLKLILQPIVENAVHHGIHGKQEKGEIRVSAFSNEDEIVFIVTDDGEGMTEEMAGRILKGSSSRKKGGFGLSSLVQRIRLYYDIEDPVIIHSEPGNGTEIIVRIKKEIARGRDV